MFFVFVFFFFQNHFLARIFLNIIQSVGEKPLYGYTHLYQPNPVMNPFYSGN